MYCMSTEIAYNLYIVNENISTWLPYILAVNGFFSHIALCDQDAIGLGNNLSIPDSWLTASSELGANTPAKNGRLNYTAGPSWCASSSDNYPYLEIDLQIPYIICAVSSQGNHQADQWVKTFSLQSSTDGRTWTNYTDDQVSIKVNIITSPRLAVSMLEL